MKFTLAFIAVVAAEKMTTEVGETSNMHYLTNRLARDQSCLAPGKCLNPYCSLYDCYERNDKPLCAGEKYDGKNIPKEAKVGIHHNIKETVVKGWTRRLYEDYARHHARDMRTIINDWNTNNLWMFIGAQHANDKGNDYYMGAFAPTRKVFARCNNSRHCGYRTLPAADCIYGAYWYCVTNWSFGFSARNQVRLCSADTYGVWGGYDPGHSSNHRLSWHMHYWYTAGWRAGYASSMNSERTVYKAVFTKVCNGCGQSTPLDQPECKQTSCYYKSGQTSITTNGQEKFHCEKVTGYKVNYGEAKGQTTNCKCTCTSSFKCALKHHHTTGYLKTFTHC